MALEIYAYKCKKCGQLHYPYRMVCKKCGKNDVFEFDTVPLPKKGKLLTFTTVYNLPPDFNVAKLGLGIVELENGMRITGQLKIAEPEARHARHRQGRDRARGRIQQELRHRVLSRVRLLSIGDQVQPGIYRLHSCFKRAVNYEHRGRLVSVVDESIGPGPLNIVIRAWLVAGILPAVEGGILPPGTAHGSSVVTARGKAMPPGKMPAAAARPNACAWKSAAASCLQATVTISRPGSATTPSLSCRSWTRAASAAISQPLVTLLRKTAPPHSLAFLLDGGAA